jgi:hypothetical protein
VLTFKSKARGIAPPLAVFATTVGAGEQLAPSGHKTHASTEKDTPGFPNWPSEA